MKKNSSRKLIVHDRDASQPAPAAVFAHGFPFTRTLWSAQTNAFISAGIRVIDCDLRGFGENTSDDELTPPDALRHFIDSDAVRRRMD